MDVRGFNLSGGMTAAAEGSFELATKLREYAKGMSFHVKFCTASFKDAGQLRARFRRRAEVTLRPYEIISSDDTILFGAIPTDENDARDDMIDLSNHLDLSEGWIRYDPVARRIELPLSAAETIAEHLSVQVQLVEIHPTHERLEVSVVNLNNNR